MVSVGDLNLHKHHPLPSELLSLQNAVTQIQEEAYTSAIKLQQHSLDYADAQELVARLEQENASLKSELSVLRLNPHPDLDPEAHPAVAQVQQLTLSLRRLSDKFSLTENALLERTTQLTTARSDVIKAKLAAESAFELAARTRGREEEGKSRELELAMKLRTAEESAKMSDLVVQEYAALVRSLEAKAGSRPNGNSSPVFHDTVTNAPVVLKDSLAEGKLGLQRLVNEFSTATENLQSDLLRVQGELVLAESKHDAEKRNLEHHLVELSRAQHQLERLRLDDTSAAKMVSRYMKFSQQSTDVLQDAIKMLKTRHEATSGSLYSQLALLSSEIQHHKDRIQELTQLTDELSVEVMKESYGRRRETALRLRMVTREETIREGLERWILRAEEGLAREVDGAQVVTETMIADAHKLLTGTLGGVSSDSSGTHARLLVIQNAFYVLTTELEREQARRLQIEQGRSSDPFESFGTGKTIIDNRPPLGTSPSVITNGRPPAQTTPDAGLTPDISAPLSSTMTATSPGPSLLLGSELPTKNTVPSEGSPVNSQAKERDVVSGASRPASPQETSPKQESSGPTPEISQLQEPLPMLKDTPAEPDETDEHLAQHTAIERSHSPREDEDSLPVSPQMAPAGTREHEGGPGVCPGVGDAGPELEHEPEKIQAPPTNLNQTVSPHLDTIIGDIFSQIPHALSDTVDPIPSSYSIHDIPSIGLSEVTQRTPHPLLSQLGTTKCRYDELQRAFRDCYWALETLKESLSPTLDPADPQNRHIPPDVLRTAVQRLTDYTEDARVELEIQVADEDLMARGFETLLSIHGALSSPAPSSLPGSENHDTPDVGSDQSELESQITAFVSGEDSNVHKAQRNFSRKLEDIQHDIAALKRAVHDDVLIDPPSDTPAADGTADGRGGNGLLSWIRSPSNPSLSATGHATPTFGSVITSPRLRHSPSSNFPPPKPGRRIFSETMARDPFASLGLKVPMPHYVHRQPSFVPLSQTPQRARTVSTMYMLGLGARSPSSSFPGSPAPMQKAQLKMGPPPRLNLNDSGMDSDADASEAEDDVE